METETETHFPFAFAFVFAYPYPYPSPYPSFGPEFRLPVLPATTLFIRHRFLLWGTPPTPPPDLSFIDDPLLWSAAPSELSPPSPSVPAPSSDFTPVQVWLSWSLWPRAGLGPSRRLSPRRSLRFPSGDNTSFIPLTRPDRPLAPLRA